MGYLQELKSEIENNPLELGYIAGSDASNAAIINDKKYSLNYHTTTKDIFVYLASDGTWLNIVQAASNPADENYQIALSALTIIKDCHTYLGHVDLSLVPAQTMLTSLVNCELITIDQKTYLDNMNKTLYSRAEVLWGKDKIVTIEDLIKSKEM